MALSNEQVALPVGKLDALKGSTKDIEYMEALLKEIKSNKVCDCQASLCTV